MKDNNRNLFYLDEIDYKVASDYSDVRGWKVVDSNKQVIGKVDNLLVNKAAERVVYLDVEADENLIRQGNDMMDQPASQGTHGFVNKDGEKHLIIPIGVVDLDEDNKHVCANQIGYETFARGRRRSKDSIIDRNYEVDTLKNYFPEESMDEETFSNDDLFYKRREFENRFQRK